MTSLLSVQQALENILEGVNETAVETIPLAEAGGRVLAEDLNANRTQPPFPASAMDGYAVRACDIQNAPVDLKLIGESAAGHGFVGKVGTGECVRIFTGAPVPEGADTIVIQENVSATDNLISILQQEPQGRYVRPAGLDFSKNETLLQAGHMLNPSTISLAAAMNHPNLTVHCKPKVAIIATGDELVPPGASPGPDQIIASNGFGVAEIVKNVGGVPIDLGIATDSLSSLEEKFAQTEDADIVITLGGASVGDHDLVREALERRGVELNFWKLAMRPGKPVMFGKTSNSSGTMRYLGLPGNPVSSLVCAMIFLVPLIKSQLGLAHHQTKTTATLTVDLPENDQREEYMRATYEMRDGRYFVTPFNRQDSSMLSLMSKAGCLLIRPAHAAPSKSGDPCKILLLF